MATIPVSEVTRAGLLIASVGASNGGDEWVNTGEEFLYVDSGGSETLTFDIKGTLDGLAITDRAVALSTVRRIIGPFPPGIYNDPVTGRAKVTSSSYTTTYYHVIRFAKAP